MDVPTPTVAIQSHLENAMIVYQIAIARKDLSEIGIMTVFQKTNAKLARIQTNISSLAVNSAKETARIPLQKIAQPMHVFPAASVTLASFEATMTHAFQFRNVFHSSAMNIVTFPSAAPTYVKRHATHLICQRDVNQADVFQDASAMMAMF